MSNILTRQAALSVLYNTAELAFILLRSGHRGLHPGTSIVADLFLTVNLTLAILLPVMVCRQGWCTWEGTRRDFMPELGPWWTGGPTFAFSVLLALVPFPKRESEHWLTIPAPSTFVS